MVDIVITFVNTENQQNGIFTGENVLNELKSKAEGKGSSVPFIVAQVRTKF